MIRGLSRSLLLATTSATAATVVGIFLLEAPLVESQVERVAHAELGDAAEEAVARLDRGAAPDAVADEVGAREGCRVTIVDRHGTPLGDTGLDEAAIPQARVNLRVMRAARGLGFAYDISPDPETQIPRIYAAVPAEGGERVVIASRAMRSLADVRTNVRDLLLLGSLVALVIGAALTFALARALLGPISRLTDVANALKAGDLSARSRSERDDEIGEIGRAIDGMADELVARIEGHRAEEAQLRTVLDSMGEAVFVTDARGTVGLTNPAFDKIAESDAIGRTVVEAIRAPELHDAVSAALEGNATGVEFEFGSYDARRDIEAVVAPLPDGAGVVGVMHDVTKLKLTDTVRRDFVANASHELRTPLTAIRGYAETLRDGALDQPAAAKAFLEVILKHATRLQTLVDDLVSLSKAESPDQLFDLDTVDVGAIAGEVASGLDSPAKAKGITVTMRGLGDLPPATGNERAIDQILVNFIDNAIKYTAEGGEVRVVGASTDDWVEIHVEDTGQGIARTHLERIFERFYRVDPGRSRDVGGTGLGLAIVKHLAERIGAEVVADSELGEGSRFTLRVARDRDEADRRISTRPDAA